MTFPEYLQSLRLRPESVKAYDSWASNYFTMPESERQAFLNSLTAANYKNYYCALRHWNKWRGLPFSLAKPGKSYPKQPDRLTDEQVQKLRNSPTAGQFHIKAKALFSALISSGLRISELLNLRKDQLAPRMMVIGKGGKPRMALLDEKALVAIRFYQETRGGESNWMFSKRDGGRMDRSQAYSIICRWARAHGVDAYPHQLRHTFAQKLLNMGCDIKTLQEALGHSNIATTDIYLKFDPVRLEKFHALASGPGSPL